MLDVVDAQVVGRPATFATASEAAWRAAVAAAVGTREVPGSVRFAVEIEFRLPPARTRNDAWDLDNLIKPTLDALGGVIGWRVWNGKPRPMTSESTESSRQSGPWPTARSRGKASDRATSRRTRSLDANGAPQDADDRRLNDISRATNHSIDPNDAVIADPSATPGPWHECCYPPGEIGGLNVGMDGSRRFPEDPD